MNVTLHHVVLAAVWGAILWQAVAGIFSPFIADVPLLVIAAVGAGSYFTTEWAQRRG